MKHFRIERGESKRTDLVWPRSDAWKECRAMECLQRVKRLHRNESGSQETDHKEKRVRRLTELEEAGTVRRLEGHPPLEKGPAMLEPTKQLWGRRL